MSMFAELFVSWFLLVKNLLTVQVKTWKTKLVLFFLEKLIFFMESFTKREIYLQFSRGEKSTCNKFHEQKTASNKLQEQFNFKRRKINL